MREREREREREIFISFTRDLSWPKAGHEYIKRERERKKKRIFEYMNNVHVKINYIYIYKL